jgi:hypothetical protein
MFESSLTDRLMAGMLDALILLGLDSLAFFLK